MARTRAEQSLYLAAALMVFGAFLYTRIPHQKHREKDNPAKAINVALSLSESAVDVREPVIIQALVTNPTGSTPVAGAPVTFTITRPGGTTTLTVNTDASGVADWKYKAQFQGDYTVSVTTSFEGADDEDGPMMFTAKPSRFANSPAA